jgi:hypothetical protein
VARSEWLLVIGIANLAGDAFGFLKDQVKGVFQESLDAQQGLAQTNAVLKSTHDASGMTAQAVLDLAGQYSHLTRFSDDTVQSAENMLLTFTSIGKDVFPQATKTVLDMSQALGQDTKSSAIQLGKALNDPVQGVTALQRVGVTFTDKQKEVIKKLWDTGNAAGAQKVVLDELQREFGGTAEAAGKTLPGQLDILKQNFADLKQNIGDMLIPKLTDLVGYINKQVMPKLADFSDWFTKHATPKIQKFTDFVSKNAPTAFNALKDGAHTAVDGLKGAFDTIEPVLGPPLKRIGGIIGDTFGKDFQFVKDKGQELSSWFGADMVPALQKALPGFAHLGDVLLNTVAPALVTAWSKLEDFRRLVADAFIHVFEKATPLLVEFGGAVADKLGSALQFVTPYFNSAVDAVSGFAHALSDRVMVAVDGFFSGLEQMLPFFQAVWDSTWAVVGNQLAGTWKVMSGAVQVAWSVLSGIVLTGLDVLQGHWGQAWDDIKNGLAGTWNGIMDIVGGGLRALGIDIGNFGKIATGSMSNTDKNVSGSANDMKKNVVQAFSNMEQQSYAQTSKLSTSALANFQNLNGDLQSQMSSTDEMVIGYWNDIANYIDKHPINGHVTYTTAGGGIGVQQSATNQHYAGGTDYAPGGLSWVGESGKELIDVPKGSKIFDHATSMKIASGSYPVGSSGGSNGSSSSAGSSGGERTLIVQFNTTEMAGVVMKETDRIVRVKLGGGGRAT